MGYFPAKINDLPVQVKEKEFPPRGRPIQGTKGGEELNGTMGITTGLTQEIHITRLSGRSSNRRGLKRVRRSNQERDDNVEEPEPSIARQVYIRER